MKLKIYAFLITIFITSNFSFSQTIDHWETIIQVGDNCPYFVPTSDIGIDWREKDYDDNTWPVGQSGFGYGDNDDNTVILEGTTVVYMRFSFTIENKSDIASLLLDVDYDDGFVAFLNGTEIARANVQDPISWNMELEHIHEAGMYQGINPERFKMDQFLPDILNTGKNVLAIEVHNHDTSSSDLSGNVFLHAGITTADTLFGSVSDWFWLPVTYTKFNLPLMIINTNGQEIPDEPRISAEMDLINNGQGMLNSIDDEPNEYSGKIAIELRGHSSLGFAKKSFTIETQKEDHSNNNVSLLGLPKENDFVLYGPHSDKTMVKNVLTYELYRSTGRWAPRTRYIEIILNGDYRGVYVFTEKLKRDNDRVDIDKLTKDEDSLPDISGGYILRRDKKEDLSPLEWWTSPVEQPFHERIWYEYYDPDYFESTGIQRDYIKDWMKNFDQVLSGSEFTDLQEGYRKYIKPKSFVDMMFINEISKGIDNYMFSTYFYKENDTDDGKLVAGPPWDYNLGYGNVNYGEDWDAKETYGWCYPQWSRVYWFERLMEDDYYRNLAYCRWTNFRENIFSDESVIGIIDSCVMVLGDAVDRNFEKYPTLGNYVWPAVEPFPETYEGEIENLKTWLLGRLAWMDSQWANIGFCDTEPPTGINLSSNNIQENMPEGTLVGTLSTIDSDSDNHVYFLSSGKGDDDNIKFIIEKNKLLSNDVFDRQAEDTYSIRIRSEDRYFNNFEKEFTINILDSSSTTIDGPIKTPTRYALKQNFPNPFNSTTKIQYSLAKDGDVKLAIYDLQGKEVANLVNEFQTIGNYEINFDASALTSGVYFYRIQSGDFVDTKKLMMLR